MKYDLFISHASEDKVNFVRPLANKLRKYGLKIWYDEFNLKAGDSLKISIENAIKDSKYGIVVLSNSFFNKKWTNLELNTLFSKEIITDQKIIIPIWLDLTPNDVYEKSPLMVDKLAISTSSNSNIDMVVDEVLRLIFESKYKPEEIIYKIDKLLHVKDRLRLKVLSDEIIYRISQLTNYSNEVVKRVINSEKEFDDVELNEINEFYSIPEGVSCDSGWVDSITEKYWKKQLKKWIKGNLSEDECWELLNDFFMFRDFDYKYIFYGIEGELIPSEPKEGYYQNMIKEIGTRNFA